MSLRLVTPASETIISLAEAKRQLRVTWDDENEYIQSLVNTVNDWLSGESSWLGISVAEQSWELKAACFGCGLLELPRPPLVSVDSVHYTPDTNVEVELTDFREIDVGVPAGGGVMPLVDVDWPDTNGEPGSVRINFTAGYTEVPASIKHAALLMVSHYYENRDAVLSGVSFETLPMGVRALLAPYRNHFR